MSDDATMTASDSSTTIDVSDSTTSIIEESPTNATVTTEREQSQEQNHEEPQASQAIFQLQQDRSNSLLKLRAYEFKRRSAYCSKLHSSSLYWRAFRSLLQSAKNDTHRADLVMRGWTNVNEVYGRGMRSVSQFCVDDKSGCVVVDDKRKKKMLDAMILMDNNSTATTGGGSSGGLGSGLGALTLTSTGSRDGGFGAGQQSSSSKSGGDKKSGMASSPTNMSITSPSSGGSSDVAVTFTSSEKCSTMIQQLADSAGGVGRQYEEMVDFIKKEVLPQLALLHDQLNSELSIMEKLGDSILHELEAAEKEVCNSWELYYNKAVEFNGSSHDSLRARNTGAQIGTIPDPTFAIECSDVWIHEMRYRMSVAFLSSSWEKCSSELSNLFLAMKNAECDRRSRMKELLIKAMQRQDRLWLGLPGTLAPVLQELIQWPMERKLIENDVQSSIRSRAQAILREEAEHKKANDDSEGKPKLHGLTGLDPNEGNFELSSPLMSDLMCKAKVLEKRSGLMSTWKVTLGVVTSDFFLQLFELPTTSKLQPGSAPEVAFHNLIPPVVVPTMEIVRAGGGGVKLSSTKHWFDNFVPSESIALPNCVVSLKDDKSSIFEIVETILTSGASKMFTKTVSRKIVMRAITRGEAEDFINTLKGNSI